LLCIKQLWKYTGVLASVLVPLPGLPLRDSPLVLTHYPYWFTYPYFFSTDKWVDLGIGSTDSGTPVYLTSRKLKYERKQTFNPRKYMKFSIILQREQKWQCCKIYGNWRQQIVSKTEWYNDLLRASILSHLTWLINKRAKGPIFERNIPRNSKIFYLKKFQLKMSCQNARIGHF
jgi:hypothetical protein